MHLAQQLQVEKRFKVGRPTKHVVAGKGAVFVVVLRHDQDDKRQCSLKEDHKQAANAHVSRCLKCSLHTQAHTHRHTGTPTREMSKNNHNWLCFCFEANSLHPYLVRCSGQQAAQQPATNNGPRPRGHRVFAPGTGDGERVCSKDRLSLGWD